MGRSASPADRAIVVATRALIRSVERRSRLCYADGIAGPISPMSVQIIARQLGADIIEADLGQHTHEIAVPGYCGPPVIVVNRYAEPAMRHLACRHGLAHLAAGDIAIGEGADVQFMSSILDDMTPAERVADCFALADVVPGWQLESLVASNASGTAIEHELRRHIQALAPRWPAARVRDRTRLRLALFWEGIDR